MWIDQLPEKGQKFAFNYEQLGKNFASAIQFMETANFDALPLGRTEIDGDKLFVLMQEYTQKAKEPAYEVHDRYADIQLVLSGSERFRWGLGTVGPLDAEKDKRDAQVDGPYTEFTLQKNQFVVFLPGEPHAPGLPEKGEAFCRKAVLKVLIHE